MTDITIGVDISKDHLDVHRLPGDEGRCFANTKAGHKELLGWIGPAPARIVFEATGAYHRALETCLAQAGMPTVKVNPLRARRFAEAVGQLAKTDKLDAAMLARMGAMLGLEPRPASSKSLNDLKELQLAREALVKDRTAARNRAKNLTQALLKRQNNERLAQIERQLEAIDTTIIEAIGKDQDLKARLTILCSIPGIAAITAAMLVIEMPELGHLDPKQVASLAGLAPVTRQSGKWKGKSFIHAGRARVRHALYMPALVAMRFNTDMAQKYNQLITAGKAKKLAITAIMRKLIVLANALLKARRIWLPQIA
jgi:transposase